MRDLGVGFVSTPPVTSLAAGVLKRLATVALDGGPANAPHHSRSSKRSVTVTGDVGGGSRDGSRAPCDPSDFCDRLPPSLICCDSHTLHFKTAPGSSAPSAAKTCAQYGPFESIPTVSTPARSAAAITQHSPATGTANAPEHSFLERAQLPTHPTAHRLFPDRVVQPYDADAFGALLQKHKLTTAYPSSLKSLCEGFTRMVQALPAFVPLLLLSRASAHAFPAFVPALRAITASTLLYTVYTVLTFRYRNLDSTVAGLGARYKSFHCTCPVLPAHKPFLIVHFDGEFFLDHCFPFGAASASSITAGNNAGSLAGLHARNKSFDRTCPVLTVHKPFPVVHFNGEFFLDHRFPFSAASACSGAVVKRYEDDLPVLRYLITFPSASSDSGEDFTDGFSFILDCAGNCLGAAYHFLRTSAWDLYFIYNSRHFLSQLSPIAALNTPAYIITFLPPSDELAVYSPLERDRREAFLAAGFAT
ncbi:hypothetical protein DFH09DRAFT_1425953 [Mycena vulgaris]|nr:hypothetical protein DFH09DRAFT_1425953 [Mycena vulgaris]